MVEVAPKFPIIERIQVTDFLESELMEIRLQPPSKSEDDDGLERINVVAGRNGSGKTQLLILTYLALSSTRSSISDLASRSFGQIDIEFKDFHRSVRRTTRGQSVDLQITSSSRHGSDWSTREVVYRVNTQGGPPEPITTTAPNSPRLAGSIRPVFIDDRRVAWSAPDPDRNLRGIAGEPRRRSLDERDEIYSSSGSRAQELETVMRAAHQSLSRKMLEDQIGTGGTNQDIYAGVLTNILRRTRRSSRPSLSKMREDVLSLRQRAEYLVDLGAPVDFVSQSLADALAIEGASASKQRLAIDIVEPYLDTIESRLTRLESVRTLVDRIRESANALLYGKQLDFNFRTGFRLIRAGSEIPLNRLSSGEQHLLLLMCNVVRSRESGPSLLLIDEPEISLDPAWQRRIISEIDAWLADSPVSVLTASHCIPLIASSRHRVADISRVDRPSDPEAEDIDNDGP